MEGDDGANDAAKQAEDEDQSILDSHPLEAAEVVPVGGGQHYLKVFNLVLMTSGPNFGLFCPSVSLSVGAACLELVDGSCSFSSADRSSSAADRVSLSVPAPSCFVYLVDLKPVHLLSGRQH